MTNDQILFLLLAVGLTGTIYYGRKLLKGDNQFFYKNGRAMRALDITLSGEKEVFNLRMASLSEETLSRFANWVRTDFFFIPVLYGSVAILCYFSSGAYYGENWENFFRFLIVGQVIACLADIAENLILLQAIKKRSLTVSMNIFNFIIGIKLFFVILGIFVSFATAVLVWFRFLNSKGEAVSSLLFVLPALLLFLLLTFRPSKKKKA